MRKQKEKLILHNHNNDGVDRRGFLKCMAWAGTGALFVMKGGILRSYSLSDPAGLAAQAPSGGELSFIQISDSHMGFNKAANPDVVATLKAAVEKINAAPLRAGVSAPHGRHQPPFETHGVRHRRSGAQGREGQARCSTCLASTTF